MSNAAVKRLPSKKVNQGICSKEDRGPTELYPTSEILTTSFLEQSGEPVDALVFEPACGLGHMVRPLVARGHTVIATDVVSYGWPGQLATHDFLSLTEPPRFSFSGVRPSCIITNPPFSLSAKFVRHGLKLCKKVIIFNRLAFLEGKGRSDIIDHHLTRVYPYVDRPPMMHRWNMGLYRKCECVKSEGCLECGGKGAILVKQDGIWREWVGKKAPSAMAAAWFTFEREKPAELGDGFIAKRISWRKSAQARCLLRTGATSVVTDQDAEGECVAPTC